MERKTLKVLSGVRNLRQQLFQELSQGENQLLEKRGYWQSWRR